MPGPLSLRRALVVALVALVAVAGAWWWGLPGDGTPTARSQREAAEAVGLPPTDEGPRAPAVAEELRGRSDVDDLAEFVRDHGEPRNADFARLRIPTLGVNAGVAVLDVDGQVMPVPEGPFGVAWYDLSEWDGLGGRPGEPGNAIFGGHVDYDGPVPYADRNYRGPGVFYSLDDLSAGDVIEVEYAGRVYRYEVTWVKQLAVTGTDWGEVWAGGEGDEAITLFTCGGTFDPDTRTYADRVVVRAERA